MKHRITGLLLVAGASAMTCAAPPPGAGSHDAGTSPPPSALAEPSPPAPRAPRASLDGRSFPDKVLAMTWDDGPDTGTLALARYLHDEHVPATFFVVGAWIAGLSEEPGQGADVFATGHQAIPVLGALVALGHHVANHTLNHVLLADAPAAVVDHQLRADEEAIEPFLRGGLRLFRAPGGAWSASASAVVDGDPVLSRLVGPVRWDVDGKDWEGSLYCRSEHPALECERAAPVAMGAPGPNPPGRASRVKPGIIAQRYLAAAESAGHGIVLLHDRVGHVGSDYALQVAKALIPALARRGFVFAAPVLRFSPFAPHAALPESARPPPPPAQLAAATEALGAAVDPATIRFGDINGDGLSDVCGRSPEGLLCALASGPSFLKATMWLPEMSDAAGWAPHGASLQLVDVDGDGRADACAQGSAGVVCALAP